VSVGQSRLSVEAGNPPAWPTIDEEDAVMDRLNLARVTRDVGVLEM